MPSHESKPITVSEYIVIINDNIGNIEVQITGEISKITRAVSGHVYFDLKDEKADAVLNCVIWRRIYQTIGLELETGMRVVVSGSGEIYAPRGMFSFKVRGMELAGEGILLKKYEELKKKLTSEGIFDLSRKRSIPEFPQQIGVITSRTGAVINDIISNLGTYGFKIKFADARVEGPEAVMSLLDAMRLLKKEPIDVLIIARGGGSLESLQAFDNELLVREVASYPVPVIAGIGHHKDVTLVALAADAHESTPTAAAILLNQSWQNAVNQIQLNIHTLFSNFEQAIYSQRTTIQNNFQGMKDYLGMIFKTFDIAQFSFSKIVTRTQARISELQRDIDSYSDNMAHGMNLLIHRTDIHISSILYNSILQTKHTIESFKQAVTLNPVIQSFIHILQNTKRNITSFEQNLQAHNPERQLRLGYSIVRSNGKIIKNINTIKKGQVVKTQIQDGSFDSTIININK